MLRVRTKLAQFWADLRERAEPLARHDVVRAASAIAFHTFFSLVPLLAITGWVAHKLALSGATFMQPLLELAPAAVKALADGEFMRLSEDADVVLPPLSIATFMWLSSGGAATTMRVFEHLFSTPRRNWFKRRMLALVFVICAIVLMAASTAIAVVAVWFFFTTAGAAALVAPLLTLWLVVAGFFRYATARKKDRKPGGCFRGAALTVTLWVSVSLLFSMYVRTLASYSKFYGGLATVVVLLVWLWLMAFALIAGGALNNQLEKRAAARAS
jgi:membrane protein